MSKSNTAEGGTDGTGTLGTVATAQTGSGDSWDVATTGNDAVLAYTNVSVMHGSLAYRIATRAISQANFFAHSTTADTSWFGRFYLMIDSISGTTRITQFRASEGGLVVGSIFCGATGALSIRSAADASIYAFAATMTLGSWYRVEWNVIVNNSTTAKIQVRLYASDSATLIEDSGAVSVTASGTIATWGDVRYGIAVATINQPSSTGFLYLDDLVTFATNWPGPAVTQMPVSTGNFFYSRSR